MKTFKVCTKALEGIFILSNEPIPDSFNTGELAAIGETNGSPKEPAAQYIRLLADVTFPRYQDFQSACIAAFGQTMREFGYTGNVYCKLIPEDDFPVKDGRVIVSNPGNLSMN